MVTIGPNSNSKSDIEKFSAHTNLFRLNGSHSSIEWHAETISLIRSVSPDALILLDIPGIKPRTSNENTIEINKGEVITFISPNLPRLDKCIELTKPLPNYAKNLKNFSLNDGQFIFDTTGTGNGIISGRSRENFTLHPKKGINIPGSVFDEDAQFEIYNAFISQIEHLEVDALGLSFVQTGALVEKIKQRVPNLLMISKIENSEGLKNCKEIAAASDAVMIDRGDLVAEIGYDKLFLAIEKIAAVSKANGKPLVMATENLESMVRRQMPSKSEVMSLAHSAQIGVDCFMLSEETAISKNKHITVSWLTNFLNSSAILKRKYPKLQTGPSQAVTIWNALEVNLSTPVVIMSKSGRAVSKFLSNFDTAEVFVVSNNIKVIKLCQLYSDSITTIISEIDTSPTVEILWNSIDKNADLIFKSSNEVLAIYVSKYVKSPKVNTITLFSRNDFV